MLGFMQLGKKRKHEKNIQVNNELSIMCLRVGNKLNEPERMLVYIKYIEVPIRDIEAAMPHELRVL